MLPALTTDDGSPISNVLNLSNLNLDITKDLKLVNPLSSICSADLGLGLGLGLSRTLVKK